MRICEVCNRWIVNMEHEEFHYDSDGCGPYCDSCMVFQRQIDVLKYKVRVLEDALSPIPGGSQIKERLEKAR